MIIKKDNLFWMQIDCKNIDDFLLPKIFKKFGIDYIPFTIRYYKQIFLREDRSKYNRKLVEYCRKHGVESFVVQEGIISGNPWGHLPLRADYFLCREEDVSWWIDQGMPKERIQTYVWQKEAKDYSEIVFLNPLYTNDNFLHPCYWNGMNIEVMRVIMEYLGKDCVFKLHPKNMEVVRRFIPFNRIVEGDATNLIKKYKKIYCFKDSSIKADCEMSGVNYELLNKGQRDERIIRYQVL